MSLVVNLAKSIQFKATGVQSEDDDASLYLPSFFWLIRDFTAKLTDGLNNPITAKDYLENVLQPLKGLSDSVESKNRIRRLFKYFFPERDCATLVRPVENEADLPKLNELKEEHLRAEFNEQIKVVRKKILKKLKPKTLNGQPLTGPMLVEVCKAYIEAINSDRAPNVEDAWNYLCQQQASRTITRNQIYLVAF